MFITSDFSRCEPMLPLVSDFVVGCLFLKFCIDLSLDKRITVW